MRCPICGASDMQELNPSAGDSFIITEVKSKTKEFIPTSGVAIKLNSCMHCGCIIPTMNPVKQ